MVQGIVSVKEIGGPLMIADMAGKAASAGVLSVMIFIALVSINLAIINLLPVPILDGGHLLFFAIEGIMGKPLDLKKDGDCPKDRPCHYYYVSCVYAIQ